MSEEDGNKFLRAITDYGFTGIEPKLSGYLGILWTAILPNLENNRARSLAGQEGGKASKRNNPNGRAGKSKEPPTEEEVKEYITRKGYNVDAEYFYNYYASIGWEDESGKPITNWKTRAKLWNDNQTEFYNEC